jgi:cell division protein FtsQ
VSDRGRHEHLPDQAALDELVRAFSDPATSAGPGVPDDADDLAATSPDTPLPDTATVAVDPDDDDGPPVDPVAPETLDELAGPEASYGTAAPAPPDGGSETDGPDARHGTGATAPPQVRHDDGSDAPGARDRRDGSTETDGAAPPEPAVADGGPDELDARRPPVRQPGATDPAPPAPIVIDIDDDLPDTVYVEGSLDAGGGRSIVLIEDDDTGDALVPESERDVRRGIEPRMRERRIAVKRAKGRKRLKWVALVAGIVLIVVGTLAVLGSPLFAVRADQVVVTGNVYTDATRLQEIVDDLVGTPVLLVDSQRIEREIEEIPWVDQARVRTDFPHAATIEIRERAAMTTYQGLDGRFRVLDREGRVLDVLDKYPFAYLLLGGPDPVDLEPGEFAPRGYAAASELAKNITGSVRGRVEEIEVTADGSRLTMHLDDGTEVRFGEARDLFAKLVRLETVLSSDEPREPGVIDVSTSEVTF